MISRREKIISAMETRLRRISIANGFDTDAGLSFDYGPVTLGPDDVGVILGMTPGTTETNPDQGGRKIIVLPFIIQCAVGIYAPQPGRPDNAYLYAERILADVKRAIEVDEKENTIFGGLANDLLAGEVTPLLREEGGQILGLQMEYRVIYPEIWGSP